MPIVGANKLNEQEFNLTDERIQLFNELNAAKDFVEDAKDKYNFVKLVFVGGLFSIIISFLSFASIAFWQITGMRGGLGGAIPVGFLTLFTFIFAMVYCFTCAPKEEIQENDNGYLSGKRFITINHDDPRFVLAKKEYKWAQRNVRNVEAKFGAL